jgi:phosphoribosylglycinamide formyltransferase-1
MYGHYIHDAVVAAGSVESGLSIHRVSEAYDEGPVLFQMRTLLTPGEQADSLAARILEGEHWAFGRVVAADLLGEPLPAKLPEGWYR